MFGTWLNLLFLSYVVDAGCCHTIEIQYKLTYISTPKCFVAGVWWNASYRSCGVSIFEGFKTDADSVRSRADPDCSVAVKSKQ